METKEFEDKMEDHRIERDGNLDLSFCGVLIGSGRNGSGGNSGYQADWTRGVEVEIYLTRAGNLITYRRYWSKWQGEGERHEASAHSGDAMIASAYGWLLGTDEYYGPCETLPRAEKEAWEEACATVPELEDQDVEEVA